MKEDQRAAVAVDHWLLTNDDGTCIDAREYPIPKWYQRILNPVLNCETSVSNLDTHYTVEELRHAIEFDLPLEPKELLAPKELEDK